MKELKECFQYTFKVTSWILVGSFIFALVAVAVVRTANHFGYGY